MSGEPPAGYYRSEARRGWVQTTALIAGAIAVFVLVDRRLKTSEALKNELDARVKAQTEPFDVRVRQLEAERGVYDRRRSEAEATIAEKRSERAGKPLLVMIPVVELTPAHKDVSEIQ